jgi:diaminohydroxyphosphoribosylaminopyrimidine deaminase / 5-amino-6-(5-phosphoribosylamino)uracil reductase
MNEELYIKRCFDLAKQGVYGAAPNPLVGALVLFHNNIIGEGYHARFGGDHAEVVALKSIVATKQLQIPESTLFVSLEPCCTIGNTPACTDFIRKNGIKKVLFSVKDPTPAVNGRGKEILEKLGCVVQDNLLSAQGKELIKARTVWVNQQRPYIILKYAESADGFIGQRDKQVWLSNNIAKVLSHKWRAEASAILLGTNTTATDNPSGNTRLYPGSDPIRIVIDRKLVLTSDLQIFNQQQMSWIFTDQKAPDTVENLRYFQVEQGRDYITAICQEMYQQQKGILLVEGGAQLLQSFINAGTWDELRIFKTPLVLGEGIPSPTFTGALRQRLKLKDNYVEQWIRTS